MEKPDRAIGSQCLNCGHVEAPATDPYQCSRCRSLDLHTFPVQEITAGDRFEISTEGLGRLMADLNR